MRLEMWSRSCRCRPELRSGNDWFLPERTLDSAAVGERKAGPVPPLEILKERLAPLRAALLEHPIYREIDSLAALHIYLENHVFAVWDFMSLLKELQRRLCCVNVPWLPTGDSLGCRFINEFVVAEESDDDGRGGFSSHFELYCRAMTRCGANTSAIDGFLDELRRGRPIQAALESRTFPACVRSFVGQTFAFIEEGNLCAIASAFTFGREDLLPVLFQRIIDELNMLAGGGLDEFKYYLNRHIGLDGDEHGPMAGKLMCSLCGSDQRQWETAERAAVRSLEARLVLWDGIYALMRESKESSRPLEQRG
jgi:hypothetical protein